MRSVLRKFASTFVCLAAASLLLAPRCVPAQTQVPRPVAGQPAPDTRSFDFTHLADRPYTFSLPKPAFPSSPRVQREFVVEYLYDYAVSTYTPEVELPILPVAQFKRDTPENALIAFFAAMRTGDYENWVKCWDAKNQKQLAEIAKEKKQDAAFWQNVWKPVFSRSKIVYLIDRVETASQYVILDARLPGLSVPSVPTTLKLVNGEWLVTNDLTNDPILFQFRPNIAGSITYAPPVDVAMLDKDNKLQTQAQQHFLAEHGVRSKVVQAGPTQTSK